MKILAACDSFKGTLTSPQACGVICNAFKAVSGEFETQICPLADGGEGTVNALACALNGEMITVNVCGPFMQRVDAHYCLAGSTAVMEMAEASGITLQPKEMLNPLTATTYGTGEMIADAVRRGAKRIIIGIGGSATNDGGAGCVRALGGSFTDEYGKELKEGGGSLAELYDFNCDKVKELLMDTELLVACDVVSPLYGENGATMVFSRQKGADESQKAHLENALKHYGDLICERLGTNYAEMHGAGAAGGLGFALVALCGGRLVSGFDVIAETVGLEKKITACDVLITGEGKTDSSSLLGKLPVKMAELAKKHGKKCVLLSGGITCTESELKKYFYYAAQTMLPTDTLEEAMANAEARLYEAAEKAARELL